MADPGTLWMLVLGALALAGRGAASATEALTEPGATTLPTIPALPAGTMLPGTLVDTTIPTVPSIPGSTLLPGTTAPSAISPTTGVIQPNVPTAPVAPTTAAQAAARPVASSGGASSPFMLSDKAMAKLGLNAVKQVTKWFLSPSDTGAMSPDVASAWQSYRFGEYGDYTAWAGDQTPLTEVADLDVAGNVDAMSAVESVSGGYEAIAGSTEVAPGVFAGEVGGLESVPGAGAVEATSVAGDTVSLLGPALQVLGVCAVLIDIGFTLAGDQSTAMKAITVAFDAAIIVCMFIPVWGWIAALVLSLVKMIVGMFVGNTMSHEQREAMELQRYIELGVKPFIRGLVSALSPRELLRYMVLWGSSSCGGNQEVAIAFTLVNPEDPSQQVGIGHQHVDGPQGPNLCYWNNLSLYPTHTRYRGYDPFQLTQDQMAELLVMHGETDLRVAIQAGVAEDMKASLNATMDDILTKKLRAFKQAMDHGLDLDDMDAIAGERRKEPRMGVIATFYGFSSWHGLVQWHLQDYWTKYIINSRDGSLNHFALVLGYPGGWIQLRDAVLESYGYWTDHINQLYYLLTNMETWLGWSSTPMPSGGTSEMGVPLFTPDQTLAARVADLETRYRAASDAVMARIAPPVYAAGAVVPQVWVPETQTYRQPTVEEIQQAQIAAIDMSYQTGSNYGG